MNSKELDYEYILIVSLSIVYSIRGVLTMNSYIILTFKISTTTTLSLLNYLLIDYAFADVTRIREVCLIRMWNNLSVTNNIKFHSYYNK
jgi:hypothetical protein